MLGYKIVLRNKKFFTPIMKSYPKYYLGQFVNIPSLYWYHEDLTSAILDYREMIKNYNHKDVICIVEIEVKPKDLVKRFENAVCVCKNFKPLRMVI